MNERELAEKIHDWMYTVFGKWAGVDEIVDFLHDAGYGAAAEKPASKREKPDPADDILTGDFSS